jgi:hypothetical protein
VGHMLRELEEDGQGELGADFSLKDSSLPQASPPLHGSLLLAGIWHTVCASG